MLKAGNILFIILLVGIAVLMIIISMTYLSKNKGGIESRRDQTQDIQKQIDTAQEKSRQNQQIEIE